MSGRTWKTTATGVLAAGALLASGSAIWALSAQGGPFMWTRLSGFAESHDRRAFRLIDRSNSPADLDAASRAIGRALTLSPYSNAARLRLAYVDTVRHGRLGPAGVAQLARSYDLTPYDYSIAAWRIRFGLEHWRDLTPELRTSVHAEAMAFASGQSSEVDVKAVLRTIRDPAGRLAAELWLQELATQAHLLQSRTQSAGNQAQ
jgi:hypothetical protein